MVYCGMFVDAIHSGASVLKSLSQADRMIVVHASLQLMLIQAVDG